MSEINDILEKIKNGELTAEEAAEKIKSLNSDDNKSDLNLSKMDILEEISTGKITADEGVTKMESEIDSDSIDETEPLLNYPSTEELEIYKRWWQVPWIIGLVVTVGSFNGMISIIRNLGHVNFWFFLLMLPLLIGGLILALTWPSDNKPWVHVSIQSRTGSKKMRISVPIPLHFTTWILKISRNFVPPKVRDSLDPDLIETIFNEIAKGKRTGNPFLVHVDEGTGDIVDIYIG